MEPEPHPVRSVPRPAQEAERRGRRARRRRAMYSGNRSGGQGHWEGGGAAGAEGPGPAGTLSPAPLFSPGTYERLALLLGSIGLLGVGNNLLVLVLYYKFQRLRTPTHLLLVNISLSDLLVSLFGVTFTFVSCLRNGWVWDTVGCVWDGFSSSLFGELGWEESILPSENFPFPALSPSLRVPSPPSPLPVPPRAASLPARPAVQLPRRPRLRSSAPRRMAFPSSFLHLLSACGGPGSVPVAAPLQRSRPGFSPSSLQPLSSSSHFSVFTSRYNSTGHETAALHFEERNEGL